MIHVSAPLRAWLLGALACFALTGPARAMDLTVYAAASLGAVLEELSAHWEAETGGTLTPVLAGSSAIARQVQAGAPADVVILANPGWMDVLQASGDIRSETRRDLLTNRLVLIGGRLDRDRLDITNRAAVLARIGDARLALALTEAVPAGIYARSALETLGLWDALAPQVVEADNVRAALALVAARAVPFGIVYATDAAEDRRVSILAEIPADSHPPILYPMAAVSGGSAEAAARFAALLDSPAGRAILTAAGFGLATRSGPND